MFDSISSHYDLLNRVLSLGVDLSWRRKMVRIAKRQHPHNILDVATGTGDSAVALVQTGASRIVGVDISEKMLDVARLKKGAEHIEFQVADGESLPFADGFFDVVTIAFGIRNFERRVRGLQEMRRVLREGGTLIVLELSMPERSLIRSLYKLYFLRIVPLIGRLISHNSYAYRYLPCSVDEFPSKSAFLEELSQAGFTQHKARSLTCGLATIFEAQK